MSNLLDQLLALLVVSIPRQARLAGLARLLID